MRWLWVAGLVFTGSAIFIFMNPAQYLMAQGLQDLEGNIGSPTFSWLGITYACVKSSLKRGTQVEWGGQIVEVQFTLIIRQSIIAGAAMPLTPGVILFVDGVKYRVAKTSVPSNGASLNLDLIDANK